MVALLKTFVCLNSITFVNGIPAPGPYVLNYLNGIIDHLVLGTKLGVKQQRRTAINSNQDSLLPNNLGKMKGAPKGSTIPKTASLLCLTLVQ